ncbi:LacI family DNA-binding transcriptional regulator [Paenibacillus mendelii]|uniref:LacI family DNA-binding transcriptional regulator n=1 Tax=Paenibacillus mendelii TaxID=206163 RepID=A0ABV6J5W1_9BACL|nr:LacI family DNA-binding transcriptional regulator [Paenibacillus mendelii]MCQ6560028.1 LacI family transcriptional regulator [Paenibacillus mendelii]
MATIKDIAREAQVSISTVSFAINGTGPVAPETKKRIMEVIERLNYHPSSSARGLVTRQSGNICLYVPHPKSNIFTFHDNNLINDMLQGIGESIDEKNYNLLLAWEQNEDDDDASKMMSLVHTRAVDGILFFNPTRNYKPIYELIKLKFPFVFMGSFFDNEPIDTVDIDNFEAGYRNTAHLIKLGHRKIGFVSPGPLHYLLADDRFEGYKEALKDNNIRYNDHYFHIGDNRETSGVEALDRFLSLKDPPTAIVAGRDIQAVGIKKRAMACSLIVPGDIAIVSFENSQLAENHDISSIRTDLFSIGREASKLLFKMIGRKKERQTQHIIIPAELVVRGSCGGKQETSVEE